VAGACSFAAPALLVLPGFSPAGRRGRSSAARWRCRR
jgi:hypothetical protein